MEPPDPETRDVGSPVALRPALPAALLFMGGILLHRHVPVLPLLWACVVAACAALAILAANRPRSGTLLLASGLGCAGITLAQLYAFHYPPNGIGAFSGDDPRLANIELEILTPPRVLTDPFGHNRATPPRQVATAGAVRLKTWDGWVDVTGELLVQVLQPHPRLRAGQRVEVLGMLQRPAPAMNPGQFDWAGYYRDQRILASLQVPETSNIRILHAERPGPLHRLREHARRLLAAGFPSHRSLDHALLRALLLGDPDPQLRDVQEQFQRTGTSHHLAISGMHVAVLGGFVYLLCRALRLSPRRAAVIMCGFVLLYGAVAMPSPPVVRSVLLCLAFGLGLTARRSVDALQLLALCVLAMLVYRPLDLFNAGFQLSFGTVLGLILFTEPFLKGMNAWRDPDQAVAASFQPRTWRTLATDWADGTLVKVFAGAVVAWVVSMPLIAWHFEQLNPWAVLFGILLAPIVLAALVLGFLKVLLTLLWPGLAETWVTLTVWPIVWMRHVVEWLSTWPRSDVPLPPPPVGMIVVYYGLLLTMLVPFRRSAPRVLFFAARVTMVGLLLWLPYETDAARRRPPAGSLRVTFLAVGAGQCAVVEPPSGRVMLVDAGSNSLSDLVAKCLGPYLRHRGCTNVDTVILSHADYDHYSAAAEVAGAYDVREVLTGPLFARHAEGNPPARFMLRRLGELQRPPRVLEPGQEIPLGADTTLEVLWPPRDREAYAANDVSLVLRLTHAGRSILFSGDIENAAMRELISGNAEDLKSDVLVAPHHGSIESLTDEFLVAVRPQAVVSSNDRTLSRRQVEFERLVRHVPLFRTHTSGAVTIEVSREGELRVTPFLQSGGSPFLSPAPQVGSPPPAASGSSIPVPSQTRAR